jgi:phosphoketolase
LRANRKAQERTRADLRDPSRGFDGVDTGNDGVIVFRSLKGWTGPDSIDGKKATGGWRAHQVPLANARDTPEHLKVLAHSHGGQLLRNLRLPDFCDYAVDMPQPGATITESTRALGSWLTDATSRYLRRAGGRLRVRRRRHRLDGRR